MVKHTQTIRRQIPTNYLTVFDHFVGLVLKGLTFQGKDAVLFQAIDLNLNFSAIIFLKFSYGSHRAMTAIISPSGFNIMYYFFRIY